MHDIDIDGVHISNDGSQLILKPARGREIQFDREGARELMEFLRMCAEEEFNQRSSFRVSVFASSGVKASFLVGGRSIPVLPRNLSYIGIYAETSPAQNPKLDKGAIIDVLIEYEGEQVSHRGVVRRRAMNGYGVFFPGSIRNEELAPHPLLRRIVERLQKRSLKSGDQRDDWLRTE